MGSAKPWKVLIVDDHEHVRELITLTLSPLEAQFFETSTAADALEVARQHRPDVVILDVQLLGPMDGYEVCRAIKSAHELTHSRVIILTTRSRTNDVRTIEAVCADAYLTKPFSPNELLNTVQRLLD